MLLYSFRRCPYAMRARMALWASGLSLDIVEVDLKNKPIEMIQLSEKATVPVLVTGDGRVIDESLDIMRWCLQQNDPQQWLAVGDEAWALVDRCDNEFKRYLDYTKYAVRFPERDADADRAEADRFIQTLEQRLTQPRHDFLFGERVTVADIAVFPFVRQYHFVDQQHLQRSGFTRVYTWLMRLLDSEVFKAVMKKGLVKMGEN